MWLYVLAMRMSLEYDLNVHSHVSAATEADKLTYALLNTNKLLNHVRIVHICKTENLPIF